MNEIKARKIRTAPGMYIILAEAEVDEKYLVVIDDGADKSFIISDTSLYEMEALSGYEEYPTPPGYEDAFKALCEVVRILDNN